MNQILVTGCQHYGSENSIEYFQRPFKNVKEMNDGLTIRANNRASENTVVYSLGDFSMKNSAGGKQGSGLPHKPDFYLNQLKGKYIIINGNHDLNNGGKSKNQRMILWYAKMYINLIHDPNDTIISDDKYYYPITLNSHVHKAWRTKEIINNQGQVALCINCGVDVWDYQPVTMPEILSIFYRWLKTRPDKDKIQNWINESNEQALYRKMLQKERYK